MIHRFVNFQLNSDPLTLERDGRILPKEEIFRQVWPDTYVAESSLTKNISILRKTLNRALELDPNPSSAHRGLGLVASLEGNFAAVRKHFEKAFAIDPLSAWTLAAQSVEAYAINLQFDPRLDPIRGEPAIAAITARLWPTSTR